MRNQCRQRHATTGLFVPGLLAIMAAALSGTCCARAQVPDDKTPPQTDPVKQPTAPVDKVAPVALAVSLDKKTFAVGDPIKMTLNAKNTTQKTITLSFNSGQRFDFTLREGTKPDGKIVWQWSRGKMFTQMFTSRTLEPGKSLTFTDTYNPKSTPGKPNDALKAGTYTLTATLTTFRNRPVATTPVVVK